MNSRSGPTSRFSDRVSDYVKFRPGYPAAVVETLFKHCEINAESTIVDMGSGTGIFARQLLATKARVIGVEPNEAMRLAGEAYLAGHERFVSVNGSAEATTLADRSADLITAAQAFHWFDVGAFRIECVRMLKPGGYVALIWNDRLTDTSPFLRDYEALLHKHGTDYASVNHRNVDIDAIAEFYGHDRLTCETFPNEQRFDWDGLWGRVRSSSYTPSPDHPGYSTMADALRELFEKHAADGQVVFAYRTQLYLGRIE